MVSSLLKSAAAIALLSGLIQPSVCISTRDTITDGDLSLILCIGQLPYLGGQPVDGYICQGGVPIPCKAGQFAALGATVCLPCPNPSESQEGAVNCTCPEFMTTLDSMCACPLGKLFIADPLGCVECPSGHICKDGEPTKCDVDSIPKKDATSCVPCIGDTVSKIGDTECKCPDSMVATPENPTICTCPEGTSLTSDHKGCTVIEALPDISTFQGCAPNDAEIRNATTGAIIRCIREDPEFHRFRTRDENPSFEQTLPDYSYSGFCTSEVGHAQQNPPTIPDVQIAEILYVSQAACGVGNKNCAAEINKKLDEAAEKQVNEETIRTNPAGPYRYYVVQLPPVVELHSDIQLDALEKRKIRAAIRITSSYTILRGDPNYGTTIKLTGSDAVRGGPNLDEFDDFFYIDVQTPGPKAYPNGTKYNDGVGINWQQGCDFKNDTSTFMKGQRCMFHDSYCGSKLVAGDYVMLRYRADKGNTAAYAHAKATLYPDANFNEDWDVSTERIAVQERIV